MKNIRSWCKLIIPSMIGVAGSWNINCHAVDESRNLEQDRNKKLIIKNLDIE
jgi:hypothetical protein